MSEDPLSSAVPGFWKQLQGEVMFSWKALVHLEQTPRVQAAWQGHSSPHPSSAGCGKRQLFLGQNKPWDLKGLGGGKQKRIIMDRNNI